jgi:hypothetical protein
VAAGVLDQEQCPEPEQGIKMRPATQVQHAPVSVPNAKRRFAALLLATLVWTFGAAACGVREGQEEVEKARQVGKQIEKKQQEELEKKLQEGQ